MYIIKNINSSSSLLQAIEYYFYICNMIKYKPKRMNMN